MGAQKKSQLVKAKSWQCLWLCAAQWVTGRWPADGTAVAQLPLPCSNGTVGELDVVGLLMTTADLCRVERRPTLTGTLSAGFALQWQYWITTAGSTPRLEKR